MLYLDTSVLVSTLTNEADTSMVQTWLSCQNVRDLVISDWLVTEFSSALSVQMRTGQLSVAGVALVSMALEPHVEISLAGRS